MKNILENMLVVGEALFMLSGVILVICITAHYSIIGAVIMVLVTLATLASEPEPV